MLFVYSTVKVHDFSYKLEDQPNEDWAQSFTSFIVPFNSMFGTPPDALSPGRDSFIREEIDKLD